MDNTALTGLILMAAGAIALLYLLSRSFRGKNGDTVYERDWGAHNAAGIAGGTVVIRASLPKIALCWLGLLAAFAIFFSMDNPDSWTSEPSIRQHGIGRIAQLGLMYLARILVELNLPPNLIMIACVSILAIVLQYNGRCLRAFIGRYKIVIDDKGITDMTTYNRFIPWEEIETIRLITRTNTVLGHTATAKRVGIFVREPEKYNINKVTKRWLKMFGTPITFGSIFLKSPSEEQHKILLAEFYRRKYGVEPPAPSDGPRVITSGQTVSGVISRNNRRNVFLAVLAQPCSLQIEVISDNDNGLPNWESYVTVTDANGKKISSSGRFEFPYNHTVDIENAGDYHIEIKSSKTGAYHLTVKY